MSEQTKLEAGQDLIRVCRKHRIYFHEDCDICARVLPASAPGQVTELVANLFNAADAWLDKAAGRFERWLSVDLDFFGSDWTAEQWSEVRTIVRRAIQSMWQPAQADVGRQGGKNAAASQSDGVLRGSIVRTNSANVFVDTPQGNSSVEDAGRALAGVDGTWWDKRERKISMAAEQRGIEKGLEMALDAVSDAIGDWGGPERQLMLKKHKEIHEAIRALGATQSLTGDIGCCTACGGTGRAAQPKEKP